MISKQDILDRAAEWGLSAEVVEKDYVLGWLLAAISENRECGSNWVFKGGTCLKKCFFETYRFSEDLDFTLLPDAAYSGAALREVLAEVGVRAYDSSGVQFRDATVKERQNKKGQRTFEGRIYYQGPRQAPNWSKVSFDLSKHERTFPPFERHRIYHAYPDVLPEAALVQTYSFPELLGEKLRALVERTRPRDLYDVVFILENRREELDLQRTRELFEEKCRAKDLAAPTANELMQLVRASDVLRADWLAMLAHQLPLLPPVEAVLSRLESVFDWMVEAAPVAPAPLPRIPLAAGEQIEAPRGVAFWGVPTAGLEAIRFAGSNRMLVEFDYPDKKGNVERRLVEPYSLRRSAAGNLLLYTFDRRRDDVRAFSVSSIRNVRITGEVFVPRQRIELTASGPIHATQVDRPAAARRSSVGTTSFFERPAKVGRLRAAGAPSYIYACAFCGREFKHAEQNPNLRKHRDAKGWDCPGRQGLFVRWG